MTGLERRDIELLAEHDLISEDDRSYLRQLLKDFTWADQLTSAAIAEISHIRATAGRRNVEPL